MIRRSRFLFTVAIVLTVVPMLGPPMLPYSYNSNYQIVQTRDAVVIHVEMIHDARIIPLGLRTGLPLSGEAANMAYRLSHRVDIPYLDQQVARGLAERLSASAANTTFRW